jgi:monoamine oxidase
MLKRRDFLAGSALLAGGAVAPAALRGQGAGTDYDVLIIGAGVAGLSAAATLLRLDPGLKVLVLEGRERIGGRIRSVDLEGVANDVELGAPYLQPAAGEDWPPFASLGLLATPDEQGRVSVYPGMMTLIRKLADASEGSVQLNSTVTEIIWRQGMIGVFYTNRGLESAVTTRRIICTVPAPLLLAETPRFAPALPLEKRAALLDLTLLPGIASAMRLPADALSLDVPRWEERTDSGEFSVQRSEGGDWVVEVRYRGGRAQALTGQPQELLETLALRDIGKSLGQSLATASPSWSETVDWMAEPMSLGAVSAAVTGDLHAALASPVEDTLFFAGDAAIEPSLAGTVHGAFESGARAGEAVAASLDISTVPVLVPVD